MVSKTQRLSHERRVIEELITGLGGLAGGQIHTGQSLENRFDVQGWNLSPHQRFQYGDLRVEHPAVRVVVEIESGGGVTNLVKYWPLLTEKRDPKHLLIVHVYRLSSKSDYIAHRRLWDYLIDRMREDLIRRCKIRWPQDWEAHLFCYRDGAGVNEVVDHIRQALLAGYG
ncbi:MAG: hypothetical protein M1553_14695 [Firmicutes bacterium]|nr:hypothetical protein [Bacillota bacterium]